VRWRPSEKRVKLAFICPSLEPGCDGVGDYTRRLAAELTKLGCRCLCIALNDRYATAGREEDGGSLKANDVLLAGEVRLDADYPFKKRMKAVRQALAVLQPDWISLQFGPYAYHHRGFCFGLGPALAKQSGRIKRHIFFHETYIGTERASSMSHRMQGFVQRLAISSLVRWWPPQVAHTHTAFYRAQLKQIGVNAEILPLLSNIPIAAPGSVNGIFDEWIRLRDQAPQDFLLGGYFGSFYPGAEDPDFCSGLTQLANNAGKKIVCFLAGKQDAGALGRWRALEAGSSDLVRWIYIGELEEEQVSRYLQQLDFGVSATPWHLVNKSGGTAALVEHGVPVLVPRADDRIHSHDPSGTHGRNLLIRASSRDCWQDGAWLTMRRPASDMSSRVALEFISTLRNVSEVDAKSGHFA
jgi:hypothetical protein